ncbi:MAG: T9SS type A sorting domain-containing protein [Candidatus Marinimicrobia bacterium]|nr:T9SS type A sorting domain-containing protein [Candidatus Neomarinimicrobiota bacterium]
MPFNPAFTLPLELSKPMDVNVAMYDITGKMVRRISEARLEAGNYDFRVDGSDLSTGIYFVRSVIGGQVLTQKMLLVK